MSRSARRPGWESRAFFSKGISTTGGAGGDYDVMPDGQHFIMLDESASEARPTGLVLVENWFDELERLAPIP